MGEAEFILRESWKRLIDAYISGRIVLRSEKDMEDAVAKICQYVIVEYGLPLTVRRQQRHRGRRVDVAIEGRGQVLLLQLKLYHDKADWKESPSMTNTVESDLKFAKNHKGTYVGIIDTIPSTSRAELQYKMKWQSIKIEKQVFDSLYSSISPKTSPSREMLQRILLVNGNEI
jgi:hypothetical protein